MNKETMYSVDVEQAVLGSLLIDNDKIDLANKIALDDFYLPQHKIIANAIIELVNKGKPADLVTVCEYINETQLNSCGGIAYIAELAKNTPTALNFKHYFDILINYTKARKLKTVIDTTLSHLGKNVFANINSSNELITKLESDLFSLANEYHKTDMLSVPDLLDNIVNFLQSEDSPFIPTGFDDLDKKIGGLEPKEITIVAARPSMGKTAWLISLICNFINNAKLDSSEKQSSSPILIFSLEMDAQSLMMRILSILSGVAFVDIKTKNLDESDYNKLVNAISFMLKHKDLIIIDDEAHLTPSILRRKLQRFIRLHGKPTFVGIDYVQLMTFEKNKENRATELSAISRELKIQCKDFNIPLVLLAQLNRSVESRSDKHPMLSDLKESGALEQDATTVILLYRDEVYKEHSEYKGIAELIVAKARNASVGTVRIQFHGACMHYRNLVKGQY